MTLLELYNSVAQLGFEDSLDDGGTIRFLQATNRSILQINELRPRKKTFVLNHIGTGSLTATRVDWCERDEDISFTAHLAKGIYFEVCGTGEYVVKWHKQVRKVVDGEEVWEDNSDEIKRESFRKNGFVPFKLLAKNKNNKYLADIYLPQIARESESKRLESPRYTGTVIIEFVGDFAYTIRNLAMYHTLLSDDEEHIPESNALIQYDMSKLVPDFQRFGSPPLIIHQGNIVLGSAYTIVGNRLALAQSGFGAYEIEYVAKPQQISYNSEISDSVQIELDEDLAALLPVLVASYIWLDDEPEKAQYYYNMYAQRAAELSRATRGDGTLPFVSVNKGWW